MITNTMIMIEGIILPRCLLFLSRLKHKMESREMMKIIGMVYFQVSIIEIVKLYIRVGFHQEAKSGYAINIVKPVKKLMRISAA